MTASLGTLTLGLSAALVGVTGAAADVDDGSLPELRFEDPSIDWAEILVDGEDVERDDDGQPYNTFGGFGAVSANNTSNLLLDYKEESPEAYWRIMNLLFDQDEGAGLTHIKVELGADNDTSSGTEPATKRSADEPANVLRGAGFHFIADAKAINPDIEIEALRWGEPSWTRTDTDLRYQWYKETIDAAYDTFGVKFDYLSPAQNELHASHVNSELEWTVEVAKRLQADAAAEDARYDYGEIKIVALDSYRMGEEVAGAILDHPEAVDYIDAIGIHYTIYGGPNLTELNKTHGMEVLYSEAVAPQIDPEYRIVGEPERGGIGGTAGAVDIADRFINAYRYEGSIDHPAHFTSYLYQPAVSAMYEGTQYAPKHLIAATDPWSGYYEGSVGIVTTRHFTQFIDAGWEYIENASYGDGDWADGGTAVDSSTRTYLTLRTPAGADGEEELTQVHANNTATARHFEVKVANLDIDERLHAWQTTGPQDPVGQAFDEDYFQHIGYLEPVRSETQDGIDYDVYQIRVDPYSILTLSTLENGLSGQTQEYVSGEYAPQVDNTVLELPYTDDFEYTGYASTEVGGTEMSYVERRGGSPRYTADQNGAFEVVDSGTDRGNVLRQQIHANNRGYTWNVWGNGSQNNLSTAAPATVLGDHQWANYTASIDFKLDNVVRNSSLENFAGLGVRQVVIRGSDLATYSARVYDDGRWQLRKLDSVVASGSTFMFDPAAWHTLSLEARENAITLSLDGEELSSYVDTSANPVMGGRISLVSGYYNTEWDNLEVTPIDGYASYGEKVDDASARMSYAGDTSFNRAGFGHFNRTTHSIRPGGSFALDFEGSGLNIFGATGQATLDVTVDDGAPRRVTVGSTADRQTSHWIRGLDESEPHTLYVAVVSGTFTLDGVDVLIGGATQQVDPAERPVEVAEQLDRLVTYVGAQPDLPETIRAVSAAGPQVDAPVTWAEAEVDEPYELVRVDGTFVNNPALTVSAHVEVIPTGLRYFIDSNADAVTDGDGPFDAVRDFLADQGGALLNDVPDQRFADGWGLRGAVTAKAPMGQEVYDKLRETGWYGNSTGERVSYELTLPAGTYEIASGHTEWWNHAPGRARNLLTEITYLDAQGEATTDGVGAMSWPHPSSGATHVAAGQFTLTQDSTVTYTVRNNGGTEAAVISWLAVHDAGEQADRSVLADLLDEAQDAPRRAYTDESWTTLRDAALAARAVHDSPESSQEQLDAAADALQEALDALVEIAYIAPGENRIAVFAGEVPELPETVAMRTISGAEEQIPVTWQAVAPRAFEVPYGVVEVSGTAGTSAVTMRVEVVPDGLVYLIDSATVQAGIESPAYDAVAELVPGLLNATADQPFDAETGWGLTSAIASGSPYVDVKGVEAGAYDKHRTTGWWASNNGSVDYRLRLPEGTYELTAGYREWWGQTRHIASTVNVDGTEVGGPDVTLSGGSPQADSTVGFTVLEDGYVDFSAGTARGSQDPVLSWLGVVEVVDEPESTLESLAVTAPPDTTEYEIGQELDLTGLEVTATYSDGATQVVDIADLVVSGYDSQEPGEQTVTVGFTAGDVTRSASFVVTVAEEEPEAVLESLAVTALPDTTEYEIGQELDLAGLEVTATYSDGSTQVVELADLVVSGYDPLVAGEQTVAVGFTAGDVTRSTTFTVSVTAGEEPAPTLEYLVVSNPPAKTTYTVGEVLDLTGLTVAAGYSDGTTVPVEVDDLAISGYDSQIEGEQTVTVGYTDGEATRTATFVVTVEPATGPGDGPTDPTPTPTDPAPAPTDDPTAGPSPTDGPRPGVDEDLPSTGMGGGATAVAAALMLLLTGAGLLLLRRRHAGAPAS